MATANKNCQINTMASNGDIVKLYPNTKIANVEGLQTSLDAKVDKISGKGLSTNDYTTTEKNKLAGIAAGATANIGTVTQVKVGSTAYNPSSGVVSLPAYPTTLPASDVSSWAKASSKPSYTQDEVGDGTTYKRVSATEKTTWNNKGTYSKPSGGIPKTDLASSVQTSLGKADTALQSFTETDPTVPAWAKASTKPSYTYSEVGAAASSHTHKYAGSSSAGGAATSANKLNTNAGSATQPVYFSNGVPVATTYSLAKSVPADAKFTDTTYSAATQSAAGLMSAADKAKLDGVATGANNYSLPDASSSTKGGVKVGSNISVSSGTISLTSSNVSNALGYTPANNDGVNQALNTRVVSATYGYVQSSTSTIRIYKSADRGVILAVYGSQGGTNKQSSILVFDVQQGILSVRRLTMGGNSEVVDGVTINEYSTYHEAVVTLSVANSQWPPVIIPLMRADCIPQIEVL